VKVILDVSSIYLPLSGIGRYTLELARHLPKQEGMAEIQYFQGGRVESGFNTDFEAIASVEARNSYRRFIKALLPNDLLLKPFRRWKAGRMGRQLKDYDSYIFHSPNYNLIPVSGKSVVTVHDLSVFRFSRFHPPDRVNYLRDSIHSSIERADLLVTDSDYVRSELLDLFGLVADSVVSIPLGVDERFGPRAANELAPTLDKYGLKGKKYALSVGTIEPRKNLHATLRAYRQLGKPLRRQYPLVLVGAHGWGSKSLAAEIRTLVNADELIYLDYVSEQDLPLIYAGATVFYYMSLYEGFGLPLLEAMRSGVPIVCSNSSALPEVCGGCALQVDPESESAMAAAMERSLTDNSWREQAVGAGLQRASAYSWERTASATVRAYASLVD
jgi:glycosyltransferase involved in cell wall biosynthesis